jgi:DNA-binding NarL/FixJ family response regulator
MMRILVADDHAVVRRGLQQIIAVATDITVAAEAANGTEVLERLRGAEFDMLLMDVSMPGTNAMDLIKRVKAEWPKLPILVHSMHSERSIVAHMLKAGASGYITKDSEPEKLIAAVRRVASGGRYIDPQLAELIVFARGDGADKPLHESLSDREHQILLLLAGGRTVNDVAEHLHLSPKTVSTHKARLMEKLRVKTNAELIRYALQHHLVS